MLMEDLSWDEINSEVKKDKTVILVFGAFEAHGKHLPLKTDTFVPYEIAKRVAEKTNSLLFPPINLGFCYTLRRFPGTVSLSQNTLSAIVYDVFSELMRNGFHKFLVINGHGGNESIIKNTLKEMA
ncbi:MAG: creatininase family protein, partial [Candidatus ainarchaeum sp.]|nr:creatininase family protein [Candidatus ainarchaeum sp.]